MTALATRRGDPCGLALLGALVALFIWQPTLLAQPPQGKERSSEEPVRIRSESFKVLNKERKAVFWDQVEVVQGKLTIRSQRLEIVYADGPTRDSYTEGDIEKLVFTGDVRIAQAERRGHCERAEYVARQRHIVCTGDPWVIEGSNRIRGERILYVLEQDEVQVTRPRAILHMQLPESINKNRGKRK